MKQILRIILLSLCIYSCAEKHDVQETFRYDTEVIVVFSPDGIGEASGSGLIYKGLVRTADALKISFRCVFPLNYEEGAETVASLAGEDVPGRKRLIVSSDPEYSEYLSEVAAKGQIVNSESTRLLVLDGDFRHPDVYTAHVPVYGLMYKAGYIAGRMDDVENVRIYMANDKYRYMREGRDGFIDGFSLNNENEVDVVDYSEINDDDTEGFARRNVAYLSDAPECSKDYDMVLPVCGETIMGFLRYNREYPGSFYTVGFETDMSVYASDVPFSCVEHLDWVMSACVTDWMSGRLQNYRRFGMDEGWVELVISENYREQLGPWASEIHAQALEKEESYAK